MSEKVRVALMSYWHSHAMRSDEVQFKGKGIYGEIKDHPDIEIVTSWDDDAERGQRSAAELGVPFDPDLEAVLSRDDVDGVVVINETTKHAELCKTAARHGKHIYVTKVLSPTLAEAREVVDACDTAGVVLVTMLSRLHMPWAQQIRDLIASGTIGKLISMRIWHAHGLATKSFADGAGYLPDGHGFLTQRDGGGGAYVDMCHPQYLAPYLVGGAPEGVFGRKGSASGRGDVEDNAVVLLDYPAGPYVILEEGWASAPTTTFVEVQGIDGTILYRDDKTDPDWCFFGVRSGNATAFTTIEEGAQTGTPLDEWIRHIRNGTRADENIERTLLLSQMNEAAYRSFETNAPVRLEAIT